MIQNLMVSGTSNSSGSAVRLEPGKAVAFFDGTWDTATLTLEHSLDGGNTWVALSAKTANGSYEFTAFSDLKYRATLSSVGATTDVNLRVVNNAYPFNL